jgi:hypothetical protein
MFSCSFDFIFQGEKKESKTNKMHYILTEMHHQIFNYMQLFEDFLSKSACKKEEEEKEDEKDIEEITKSYVIHY